MPLQLQHERLFIGTNLKLPSSTNHTRANSKRAPTQQYVVLVRIFTYFGIRTIARTRATDPLGTSERKIDAMIRVDDYSDGRCCNWGVMIQVGVRGAMQAVVRHGSDIILLNPVRLS